MGLYKPSRQCEVASMIIFHLPHWSLRPTRVPAQALQADHWDKAPVSMGLHFLICRGAKPPALWVATGPG